MKLLVTIVSDLFRCYESTDQALVMLADNYCWKFWLQVQTVE